MSQYCPIYKRNVVYLTCLECETKECRKSNNSQPIQQTTPPQNQSNSLSPKK